MTLMAATSATLRAWTPQRMDIVCLTDSQTEQCYSVFGAGTMPHEQKV